MSLPVLEFKYTSEANKNLVDNIWHAQMSGAPKILTYSGSDNAIRRSTRNAAMHYEVAGQRYEIPKAQSRDEYPFACSKEGGGSIWIGHVPGLENSWQGGTIRAFIRKHDLQAGQRFVVLVTGHPDGGVDKLCHPICPECSKDRCVNLRNKAGEQIYAG